MDATSTTAGTRSIQSVRAAMVLKPGKPHSYIGPTISPNSLMQIIRTARLRSMPEPLVQFPHSVTNPSQLKGTELVNTLKG